MNRISAQLSGLEISHISNEFMEVTVLKSHSLRFFYDADTLRVRHVEVPSLLVTACCTLCLQMLTSLYSFRRTILLQTTS